MIMTMYQSVIAAAILVGSNLTAATQPNIVFILVDDMGWTGMSAKAHGKIDGSGSDFYETPNLERMAKNGICFGNAYAPASLCTPSRASILTGKTPAALHMTTPGRGQKVDPSKKNIPPKHISELPLSETTIAELLKGHGYATAHFGKWHLNGGGPGKHGFDVHDGETGNESSNSGDKSNPKDIFGITRRAQSFIKQQVDAGKPFYVQLSHYAVHSPIEALSTTKKTFEKKKTGAVHNSAEFAGMTKDFDTSVGLIMTTIKKLGIADSTYVVFMSDNGGASPGRQKRNAPLASGKGSLYEGGIRVPLIVTGPDVVKSSYSYENVIGYDLFPTICELTGVSELPPKIEGTSIVPLMKGETGFKRQKDELIFHFPHYGKGPLQVPQSAIIVDNMKMIVNYETGKVAMFDLDSDIGETKDLTRHYTDKAKELYDRLETYLNDVDAQHTTINKSYDPSAKPYNQRRGRKR